MASLAAALCSLLALALYVLAASYYFDDMSSVKALSRFPQHRKAKGQYQRWYDGYQIVISEITRSDGDGRLPHLTAAE